MMNENEFDQLMKFYGVDNLPDLVRAQEQHILRLQKSTTRVDLNSILAQSPVRSA